MRQCLVEIFMLPSCIPSGNKFPDFVAGCHPFLDEEEEECPLSAMFCEVADDQELITPVRGWQKGGAGGILFALNFWFFLFKQKERFV
jgi:hypothetical protein